MKPLEQTAAYKNAAKKLAPKRRAFAKLSLQKQRIAIAKDVIAQIRLKKIVAQSAYFRGSGAFTNKVQCNEAMPASTRAADLGVALAATTQESDQCAVCGIGSLFIGAVQLANRLTCNEATHIGRAFEVRYLRKWFSHAQLQLVESHYEQYTVIGPIVNQPDDDKRLIMIMENIISNGGKFVPSRWKHSTGKAKR